MEYFLAGKGSFLKDDYYALLRAIDSGDSLPDIYRKDEVLRGFLASGYISKMEVD